MNVNRLSDWRGHLARALALILACAISVQTTRADSFASNQPSTRLPSNATNPHAPPRTDTVVLPGGEDTTEYGLAATADPARASGPTNGLHTPEGRMLTRQDQGASPSISKSALAATVAFGDVFTYTVVFTIPAGMTISNTVLVDDLPNNNPATEPNFTYVNGSSVGPAPGPGTPDIPDFPPVVSNGNHTLAWSLGMIANGSASPYVYSFTYRVTAGSGDNRVEVGTNAASLSYDGGSVNASTDVTVARAFFQQPFVSAYSANDTSATADNVEFLRAGDVVTFTVLITNASPAGSVSTAYAVVVSDTLPDWLVYGGPVGSTPPPDAITSVSGNRTQLGWQIGVVAPGATVGPLVFTATVTSTVASGRQDNNDLRVEWRDLLTDPSADNPTDIIQMRSMNVAVSKQEADAFDPQGRVVVNEPITYTVVVTIPAGTTVYSPAHIFDTLNDGLNYGGEVSHSGWALPAAVGPSGNNTSITWTLASTIVAATDVTMTFVFTAYSDGTLAAGPINRGAMLNNTAAVRWNIGSGSEPNNPVQPQSTAGVQFVRPDIQPAKDATPSALISAGGEVIQYRITNLRNGSGVGDATAANAYDIVVTDTLPAGFGFVEAVPPPSGVFTVGSAVVIAWGVAPSLPVGYFYNPPGITTTATTIYVTATAPVTFAATSYTNTVVAQYSDQPGDIPGEQTYFFTRTKVLNVNFFETKSVEPAGQLRIGDLITYTIADNVPRGASMYWPRHEDTLPQGVRFVAGSMTLQGTTFVSSPIPITVPQGVQERLMWWTETISNLYGSASLVVTATFQARVTGINLSGGAVFSSVNEFRGTPAFNNQARVDWSTQDISGTLDVFRNSNGVASQAVQPYLADSPFTKRFGESTSGSTMVGAGDVVTYHLVVTNTGRGRAYDVVISDTLPFELRLSDFSAVGSTFAGALFTPTFSAAPGPGATGSLGWVVDAIEPGDGNVVAPSTIFTLTYSARVTDAIGAGATLPNEALLADYSSLPGDEPFERRYGFLLGATRSVSLTTPSPAIDKSVNVTGVTWLEVMTYTLRFPQSPINAALYNAAITDTVSSQITVLGVQAEGGVGAQAGFSGSVVTATAAAVTPLSQMTVTITGQVDPGASGTKVNVALLEWDDAATGGARHATASNPVTTTVLLPELNVTKSGPALVGLGANVLYAVVITNTGLVEAQNVTLIDDLPNELTFASFGASAMVTQTAGPDPLGFDLGTLAPRQSRTIWITATSPLTLTPGVLVTNTATVSTTSPGENSADNTAWHTAVVSGVVLDIRKDANVSSIAPAGAIVYTIEYSNTGTAPATGVIVTETYDSNVTFVSAFPAPDSGSNVWNTPGTLNVGERRAIVVTVTVAPALPNGTLITNLVTASASGAAARQASNIVDVVSAPALTIDKQGHGATMPGNTLVYRLNYANVGNAPATTVRLTETYPAELSFLAADPPPSFGDNVWDFGTLTPPFGGTVVVTLSVGSNVPFGAVITNTVFLGSRETGEASDSFTTRVGPIFLPLVLRNFATAPNLVVQNIVVAPASPNVAQPTVISVTIANTGTVAAPAGFWIDLYVDPDDVPQPGQVWNDIAPFGKAWVLRTPLLPGQSIVLDTTMPDDPTDPAAVYSNWPGWFVSPGAHTLYAQVDAFGGLGGLVVELDELDNLFGPAGVTVNPSGAPVHEDVFGSIRPDPRPTPDPGMER